MITEAKFKYALKDMMKAMPLEEINVTALCAKIGCHRQTFYYHYQDIYDLIAAILLNEDLAAMEKAKDVRGVLQAFLGYVKENFSFLRSTYNSAARDLTDDFIFGKINAKLFSLWSISENSIGLKKEGNRTVARRFAHIVADEFGYCFKDPKLTPERCVSRMNKFFAGLVETVLPALIAICKKDEGK
ncbi:MAG: hypothetical protein J6A47_05320 [Bacilli bacterium]|nr:hypothetical protein [Bacilli bacterium]MBO6286270.1 hypothetical protein [Bacilli bacterium]